MYEISDLSSGKLTVFRPKPPASPCPGVSHSRHPRRPPLPGQGVTVLKRDDATISATRGPIKKEWKLYTTIPPWRNFRGKVVDNDDCIPVPEPADISIKGSDAIIRGSDIITKGSDAITRGSLVRHSQIDRHAEAIRVDVNLSINVNRNQDVIVTATVGNAGQLLEVQGKVEGLAGSRPHTADDIYCDIDLEGFITYNDVPYKLKDLVPYAYDTNLVSILSCESNQK